MSRVLVVGDLITDVLAVLAGTIAPASDTPAAITIGGGGGGANTAAWLAAAGTPVTWCGVVGTDEAGAERLAELAAYGVDLSARRDPDTPTGTIVVLAERTERHMITDRGANLRLSPADIDVAMAAAPDTRHLHLSGYALLDDESRPAARYALTAAAQSGWTTSVNAASAGPLRRVGGEEFLAWVRAADILFANADEAGTLLGAEARAAGLAAAGQLAQALAAHVRLAVIKLGAAGAVAAGHAGVTPPGATATATSGGTPGGPSVGAGLAPPIESAIPGLLEWSIEAVPTEVLDATGAGDAFAAGFLAAWLGGAPVEAALAGGAELGARAVGSVGARPDGSH